MDATFLPSAGRYPLPIGGGFVMGATTTPLNSMPFALSAKPPVESDLGKRPMSSGSRLIPACVDAKINTLESEGTVRQVSEYKPSVPVNLTC